MAKNKPKQTPRPERAAKPACLEGKWNFSPDVPIYDFFEDRDPKDPSDLGEVLQDFLFGLKQGIFLTWEAIVCQELGLPMTEQQAKGDFLSRGEHGRTVSAVDTQAVPWPQTFDK